MSKDREPTRRSQSEIDKMFEQLENRKKSWQESEDKLKEDYIKDVENRIDALKFVLTLPEEIFAEVAYGRSSGYQETAADWLLFKCDDCRMIGSV
jgi:hypothetical protein